MKHILRAVPVVLIFTLPGIVSAKQELTVAEMDAVTAGFSFEPGFWFARGLVFVSDADSIALQGTSLRLESDEAAQTVETRGYAGFKGGDGEGFVIGESDATDAPSASGFSYSEVVNLGGEAARAGAYARTRSE